jgi:hypothetical protein
VYAEKTLEVVEKIPSVQKAFANAFKSKNFDKMNSLSDDVHKAINAIYDLYWFDRTMLARGTEYKADWRLDQGIKSQLKLLYNSKRRLTERESEYDAEGYVKEMDKLIRIFQNLLQHTMRILFFKARGKHEGAMNKARDFDMEGRNNKERMEKLKERVGMFIGQEIKTEWEDATPKEIFAEFMKKAKLEGYV